jgi:sporulation protein YlmC with PRC-barrel domain
MKAKLCLVASVLLFAGQAMAEEPLATPKSDPGLPAPPPAVTEPAPAPAPQTEAMTPAPEPQKDAATPAPEPQEEAATPAPAPAPQQQAEVPAEVVITELTAVDDQKKLVTPWALPADRVAEMDVYDKNGKKIGEVDAVLQDKKGEIKGVAVVHGGFLGFGSKDSIITLDRLQLKDGDIVTELTEDQLSQQPEWTKK